MRVQPKQRQAKGDIKNGGGIGCGEGMLLWSVGEWWWWLLLVVVGVIDVWSELIFRGWLQASRMVDLYVEYVVCRKKLILDKEILHRTPHNTQPMSKSLSQLMWIRVGLFCYSIFKSWFLTIPPTIV